MNIFKSNKKYIFSQKINLKFKISLNKYKV